jgi:hypothetical protein
MDLTVVPQSRELFFQARTLRLERTNRSHHWRYDPYQLHWALSRLKTHIGASGVGELLANTLAVRNVTVVVLDIKPIVTENCASPFPIYFSIQCESCHQTTSLITNVMFRSGRKLRPFQRRSSRRYIVLHLLSTYVQVCIIDWSTHYACQQRWRCARKTHHRSQT